MQLSYHYPSSNTVSGHIDYYEQVVVKRKQFNKAERREQRQNEEGKWQIHVKQSWTTQLASKDNSWVVIRNNKVFYFLSLLLSTYLGNNKILDATANSAIVHHCHMSISAFFAV